MNCEQRVRTHPRAARGHEPQRAQLVASRAPPRAARRSVPASRGRRPARWRGSGPPARASPRGRSAAHHDGAGHGRGDRELAEPPGVEHRRGDDGRLLGPPRDPVEHRREGAGSPSPDRRAPLGVPVVPEVSRMVRPVRAGRSGTAPRWAVDQLVHGGACPSRRPSRPRTSTSPSSCPRAWSSSGANSSSYTTTWAPLALQHVGELGTGEAGVQQQCVGADPGGGAERLHEAAMVAAQDGHRLERLLAQRSETDGHGVGPAPRARPRSAARARR